MQYTYCPISHEVKEPDNETWPINGIKQKEYFLQKLSGKGGRETSPRPLFTFLKNKYEVKESGLQLSFNMFQ